MQGLPVAGIAIVQYSLKPPGGNIIAYRKGGKPRKAGSASSKSVFCGFALLER